MRNMSNQHDDEIMSQLARAVHDLRGPLSVIMTYADLIKLTCAMHADNPKSLPHQDIADHAAMIGECSQYFSGIIDDILMLYRGTDSTHPEVVNLLQADERRITLQILVDQLIHMAQQQSSFAEHSIRVMLDDGCAEHVLRQPYRLQRVLQNLLSNAINMSAKNSEIVIDFACEDKILHGSISNPGNGIEFDTRIAFDAQTSSVGLGIMIVSAILQTFGGYGVWQSEPHAKVDIFLPMEEIFE